MCLLLVQSLKFAVEWFFKVVVCQIHWNYAQIVYPAGFDGQGVINKDPIIWLDGVMSNYELDKLIS